jgi:hypothetical protein
VSTASDPAYPDRIVAAGARGIVAALDSDD